MNDEEITRLAAALNLLRPDWPAKSLRTFIAKNLAARPMRDVSVAMVWVAAEPGTAKPARVLEAGPWWRAVMTEENSPRFQPLANTERCQICGRSELDCTRNPFAEHEFRPDVRRPSGVDVHRTVELLKQGAAS